MQKLFNKIKASQFVTSTCLACKTFWSVARVLGLAGIGGWLIYSSSDKITIGVGVALGLASLVSLVSLAYRAEKTAK